MLQAHRATTQGELSGNDEDIFDEDQESDHHRPPSGQSAAMPYRLCGLEGSASSHDAGGTAVRPMGSPSPQAMLGRHRRGGLGTALRTKPSARIRMSPRAFAVADPLSGRGGRPL